MADKKLSNIGMYTQLFPEYQFVWLGDSGQGDVLVAKALIAEFTAKGMQPPLVFIHDVVRQAAHTFHAMIVLCPTDPLCSIGLSTRRAVAR